MFIARHFWSKAAARSPAIHPFSYPNSEPKAEEGENLIADAKQH